MRHFEFASRLWLNRPRDVVFRFFSDALNLEEITPPWLRFRVVSKLPIDMHRGAEIEYRLKVHGVPVGWHSRITAWDPPYSFVDEQVRGPYRMWVHEHRFLEDSDGTLCEDKVRYVPRGGALINTLFVARDIQKIFAHRSDRLRKIFAEASASSIMRTDINDSANPVEAPLSSQLRFCGGSNRCCPTSFRIRPQTKWNMKAHKQPWSELLKWDSLTLHTLPRQLLESTLAFCNRGTTGFSEAELALNNIS